MSATPPASPTGTAAKALGAYYTDALVAEYLVGWAVRGAADRVMDPSFGGGVFLQAACARLTELGGDPAAQVFGVELDPQTHRQTRRALEVIRPQNLIHSDFFAVEPGQLRPLEAVVGNPPFIRFQRFSGEARARALARAAAQGVQLSRLASSWAAFLVHSTALLQPGGRLAMVVPAELGHANYARPVLEHLLRSFERVQIVRFGRTLFPEISQDTVLVLAEGRGNRGGPALLELRDLASAEDLGKTHPTGQAVEVSGLLEGRERLIEYHLSPELRGLYRAVGGSGRTARLGQVANVGIGYVTGNNDYFHLSPEQAGRLKIPGRFLRAAVRRGRALRGLEFGPGDWAAGLVSGEAGYLLHVAPEARLPGTLRGYIEQGRRQGVHLAYKCRVREPWYAVPHVHQPQAFLSYMSGAVPHLVANTADAVAPNSLHLVRSSRFSGLALAALWQTSLARLSAELEGHPMGGGMLKLEPGEAEKVRLPLPQLAPERLEELARELDRLLRAGRAAEAEALADRTLLMDGLGLSRTDCALLREGAAGLRERRRAR